MAQGGIKAADFRVHCQKRREGFQSSRVPKTCALFALDAHTWTPSLSRSQRQLQYLFKPPGSLVFDPTARGEHSIRRQLNRSPRGQFPCTNAGRLPVLAATFSELMDRGRRRRTTPPEWRFLFPAIAFDFECARMLRPCAFCLCAAGAILNCDR